MPGMKRLLALLECLFHGADEPDVLVDGDAEGEHVLLGLALVELADAELEVRQAGEGAGEGGGELDGGEGVEGGGEVAGCFGEALALEDDCVEGFEEGFELVF